MNGAEIVALAIIAFAVCVCTVGIVRSFLSGGGDEFDWTKEVR